MTRDVLHGPADFYVEPFVAGDEGLLEANEQINHDLGVSAHGVHVLRLLSRVRTEKTYWARANELEEAGVQPKGPESAFGLLTLDQWHDMVGHSEAERTLDEAGRSIHPAGAAKAHRSENVRATLNTGRMQFYFGPDWPTVLGFDMPHQVRSDDPRYPNGFILSGKGAGSLFSSLNEANLQGEKHIVGLTGNDQDLSITRYLADGVYDVTDLHGNRRQQSFMPGRYPIAIEPLLHLRVATDDAEPKVLHPYDSVFTTSPEMQAMYPLLSGKNQPCVIYHANWSTLTYRDLQDIVGLTARPNRYNQPPMLTMEQARTQLIQAFRTIHADLYNHPYFHDAFSHIDPDAMTESEFVVAWLASFIAIESDKNWRESQIVGQKGLVVVNRTGQNSGFGGQKDWEGTFRVEESNEYQQMAGEAVDILKARARDIYYDDCQRRLMMLVEDISMFVTSDERQQILSYLHELLDYDGDNDYARRTIHQATSEALSGSSDGAELYHHARRLTKYQPTQS